MCLYCQRKILFKYAFCSTLFKNNRHIAKTLLPTYFSVYQNEIESICQLFRLEINPVQFVCANLLKIFKLEQTMLKTKSLIKCKPKSKSVTAKPMFNFRKK